MTNEKLMGQFSCFHSPGVNRVGGYQNLARRAINLSFAMRPSCLKPGITFSNINIYPSIGGKNIVEIVLIDYFLGNFRNMKFNVFTNFHRCSIVIFLYVKAAKSHTRRGYF